MQEVQKNKIVWLHVSDKNIIKFYWILDVKVVKSVLMVSYMKLNLIKYRLKLFSTCFKI